MTTPHERLVEELARALRDGAQPCWARFYAEHRAKRLVEDVLRALSTSETAREMVGAAIDHQYEEPEYDCDIAIVALRSLSTQEPGNG